MSERDEFIAYLRRFGGSVVHGVHFPDKLKAYEDEIRAQERREVMRGLLSGLTQAREQRTKLPPAQSAVQAAERRGEIYGLNTAIAAIRRRMK